MADPCKCPARPACSGGANLIVDRTEARESFKAEALASWAEYRETGLHLTGAEVVRWLDSWGIAGEGECPPCHLREIERP